MGKRQTAKWAESASDARMGIIDREVQMRVAGLRNLCEVRH